MSHRRFLIQANPALTALIDSAIGPEWRRIPEKLEELRAFSEDSAFLERLAAVKRENKVRLGAYIRAQSGMVINPDSMFDLQVKRFHAYKRQLLGVFKVMHLYHCLLEGQYSDSAPCTFLFAGKAAQGYSFAKSVIHLVNAVAERINRDPRAKGRMQVVFVENFGVSNAQLLYPAAEVSEQISTAGYEASGTGNMKFMFNGAVTLGTWDGANIEIAHRAGEKNAFLFGMTADEVQTLRRCGSYLSWDVCRADSRLQTLIDALTDGSFGRSVDFEEIRDALLRGNDEYFVLREFDAYLKRWQEVDAAWREEKRWQRMSLQNIAAAGYFSSDRAVVDYARKVWRLPEWQEEMI